MRMGLVAGLTVFLLAGAFHPAYAEAGSIGTRDIEIDAFTRIEVLGPFDVAITTGSAPGCKAVGTADMLEFVHCKTDDGVLTVMVTKEHPLKFFETSDIRVEIVAPKLESVGLMGAGTVELSDTKADSLELRIAGSGDLKAKGLSVHKAILNIAGSGEMSCQGEAASVDVRIAGSGDLDARALKGKNATVHIVGSGDLDLYATESVDIRIMGSGDVTLYGDPKTVEQKVAGSGRVTKGE